MFCVPSLVRCLFGCNFHVRGWRCLHLYIERLIRSVVPTPLSNNLRSHQSYFVSSSTLQLARIFPFCTNNHPPRHCLWSGPIRPSWWQQTSSLAGARQSWNRSTSRDNDEHKSSLEVNQPPQTPSTWYPKQVPYPAPPSNSRTRYSWVYLWMSWYRAWTPRPLQVFSPLGREIRIHWLPW